MYLEGYRGRFEDGLREFQPRRAFAQEKNPYLVQHGSI
jgi:hypothetical protein